MIHRTSPEIFAFEGQAGTTPHFKLILINREGHDYLGE